MKYFILLVFMLFSTVALAEPNITADGLFVEEDENGNVTTICDLSEDFSNFDIRIKIMDYQVQGYTPNMKWYYFFPDLTVIDVDMWVINVENCRIEKSLSISPNDTNQISDISVGFTPDSELIFISIANYVQSEEEEITESNTHIYYTETFDLYAEIEGESIDFNMEHFFSRNNRTFYKKLNKYTNVNESSQSANDIGIVKIDFSSTPVNVISYTYTDLFPEYSTCEIDLIRGVSGAGLLSVICEDNNNGLIFYDFDSSKEIAMVFGIEKPELLDIKGSFAFERTRSLKRFGVYNIEEIEWATEKYILFSDDLKDVYIRVDDYYLDIKGPIYRRVNLSTADIVVKDIFIRNMISTDIKDKDIVIIDGARGELEVGIYSDECMLFRTFIYIDEEIQDVNIPVENCGN